MSCQGQSRAPQHGLWTFIPYGTCRGCWPHETHQRPEQGSGAPGKPQDPAPGTPWQGSWHSPGTHLTPRHMGNISPRNTCSDRRAGRPRAELGSSLGAQQQLGGTLGTSCLQNSTGCVSAGRERQKMTSSSPLCLSSQSLFFSVSISLFFLACSLRSGALCALLGH